MLLCLIFCYNKFNFNLFNFPSDSEILNCFGATSILYNNNNNNNNNNKPKKRHTLPKADKDKISETIPHTFMQVLVGVLMSDGTLSMTGNMARLSIQQTHFELSNGLWLMCKNLRLVFADIYTIDRNNWKTIYAFQTLTFPFLTELFKMWYVNINGHNIKILPHNIFELFTPISFAFLIMGDGGWDKSSSRLFLHLNNFTLTEIKIVQNILLVKFNIESTNYKVQHAYPDRGYIIAIPRKEINKVRELTQNHIYPSLLYKLGL